MLTFPVSRTKEYCIAFFLDALTGILDSDYNLHTCEIAYGLLSSPNVVLETDFFF